MLFRKLWLYAWVSLVVLSIMALWDVSKTTCGDRTPILLSRALTTDPWRGILLVFCLLAVAVSLSLNSRIMIVGFIGFFSAFLVSMFQTNAHNALIAISSVAIMYECFPQKKTTWKIHWWSTTCFGLFFLTWLIYSDLNCDTLKCGNCSYFYIFEYLFFWSMFLLVYWRIPIKKDITDEFTNENADKSTGIMSVQNKEETNLLIAKEIKF